ncbi:MAG: InlB B-repeat-containing protein [Candidatus Thiodiazotropha sp.]|nr:InlB B-repeat-containing protein [Candidatus Thiodiazotropha sp.]
MKHSKILISTLMVLWVSTMLIFSFIVLGACEQPESSDGKIDLGTRIPETFSYTELTEFVGVEATSSVPTWTGVIPTDISYSITERPASATAEHVTIESSTGGITITTETTSLDSGDYTVTATVGDNDPVYTKDSIQTATIKVTVNTRIPETFSYAELTETAGIAATSSVPTWTGVAPTAISYSITEKPASATAEHVTIESSTGVVTITTGATSLDSGDYTVTATVGDNDPVYTKDSAQTATITVTVNKADLNTATFSYAELTGFVGNEVSPVWTGTTPTDVFYSIVTSPAGAAADYVIVEPSTGVITIAAGATSADNSDYTVTATVGDNDPVYTKASTQTATTTVTVYTPISATFSYDDLTEFAGVAATSSVPRWTGTAPTAISYSIKTRPAEATAEHVTIESSTGMVTITTSTTSLDSGDYTVIATVGDNDPAYTKDSAQTATITVTVNKADLNTVTFSYDELTGTAGVETKSPAPTWTGMAPTDVSYSLRGWLGGHIIIDSSTGVITITTDAIRGESDSNYGVTATVGGSDPSYTQDSFQTITLAITVEAADLSTVTFSYDELTGTAGVEAKSSLPRWTRVKPLFAIYSITDRPVGATVGNVVIVASSEDDAAGEVTITTEATSLDSGDYTVTVTIGTLDPVYVKDSTQTATITVTVNKANQITAAFSYANLGSKAGVAATSTTPAWSGGTTPTDISYSITERPANATASNVTFNSSTGMITITTGAISTDNGDYTVTATVGSNDPVYAKDVAQTATIKIEVGDFLVSFDVDGGDGSVPDQAVVNGAFATDPSGNLPTKTGYVLTGWAEQRGGATGFNFESTAITGDITLFAQWTAGEYEVTLDGNDDDAGTPSIVTATFGQAMPTQGLSAITSLDFIYADRFGTKASGHYIFMGYFANADGSGDQYYDDSMNAITAWNQGAAATIYAKWKKPKYTVTFDYGNGTAVQGGRTEVKVALGDPMPTSPNLLAPFPNDNLVVFKGFTYQSNIGVTGGGSPIDMYYTAAGEGLPLKSGIYLWNIGGDGTVYASYGPLGYEKRVNVYSHHDPSSLLTSVVMQSDGFSSTLSETRLGYTSASDVYQKQDGTGIHTNSASWDWSRNDGVGFVKWIPKTYTVTLDSGGNGGSSTVTATYDAVMLAGRTAPAQAGMKFAGYFTEINGGGTQYYTHDMVSANIWKEDEDSPTIYAKWIASTDIIVSFQYDLVGEVIETVSGASGATLTVPTATRAGYTFTDWDTAPPSTIPNADTRYQAQWTAKAYTITLTPNGGSSGDQAVNATMGARLSNNGLTQPARTGYTFNGYGRYSDGSGTKYFDDSMTAQANWDQVGDTTIYAEWLAKQTTVTLDDGGGNTQTLTATYDNQLPNAGLTVPVRAGYVFEGYYAGADGVGSQYFNKYFDKIDQWDQDVANATIYPKWSQ